MTLTGSTTGDVNRDGVGDVTLTFSAGTQAVLLGVQDVSAVHFEYSAAAPISAPFF